MIKAMMGSVLFMGIALAALATAGGPLIELCETAGVRVRNDSDRFYVCELIVMDGRVAYWELPPGASTACYAAIHKWRCY